MKSQAIEGTNLASGDAVLQIPTLCCPGESSEAIPRFGVVGIADGPVKF